MPGGSCSAPSSCSVQQCSPGTNACPEQPWGALGSRHSRSKPGPPRSLREFGVAPQAPAPRVKSLRVCDEPAPGCFSQAEPVPTGAAGHSPCGSALSAPGLTFRGVNRWITLSQPASAPSGLQRLITHSCHSGFSTCLWCAFKTETYSSYFHIEIYILIIKKCNSCKLSIKQLALVLDRIFSVIVTRFDFLNCKNIVMKVGKDL